MTSGAETASTKTDAEAKTDRACALVGEMILITNSVDHQLNYITIAILHLTSSPMLEAVVASIDSGRKLEILKSYAGRITSPDWKKAILKYSEAVERVNRARNIAAHSLLSFEDGEPVLVAVAAAKLLKSLDLNNKTADKTQLKTIEDGIKKAENTLSNGQDLLADLARLNEERSKRNMTQR